MGRRAHGIPLLVAAALIAGAVRASETDGGEAARADAGVQSADAGADAAGTSRWCAPEIEALDADVCTFTPSGAEPRTLVIFLHGLVKQGTTWQWNQQRAAVRAARRHHFAVLVPHGRLRVGRKEYADSFGWPTASAEQQSVEAEVLDEWAHARSVLEERRRKPFEKLWVFGFSAGAYYATSLALRDRFAAQGYAVFAGGAAPKQLGRHLRGIKHRPPIYVGWGLRDKARRDPASLAKELRAAGWKVRAGPRARVGHSMSDSQVDDAVKFFGGA